MHTQNCYMCKYSALIEVTSFWGDISLMTECRSPLLTVNKHVVNSMEQLNFISVLGCASFESNNPKKE